MSLLVISQGTTSTIDSFFIFTTQTTARSRRPLTWWFLQRSSASVAISGWSHASGSSPPLSCGSSTAMFRHDHTDTGNIQRTTQGLLFLCVTARIDLSLLLLHFHFGIQLQHVLAIKPHSPTRPTLLVLTVGQHAWDPQQDEACNQRIPESICQTWLVLLSFALFYSFSCFVLALCTASYFFYQ